MTDYPTGSTSGIRNGAARLIVLHSTETPHDTAHAVARNFQNPANRASAHWIIGTDGIVSGVPESDVAWAAPGANHDGIQIEQCGFAYMTDWTSGDGAAVVAATATVVAGISQRWDIPLRHLSDDELAAGASGVVTHAQVSRVYRRSDHTDPGPDYPISHMLALASGEGATTAEASAPAPHHQEDTMQIISTTTPWGTTAYALVTETSAAALGDQEAQAYASAVGRVGTLPWDHYCLMVRQAWERRASLLADMGRTMSETVAAAAERVIQATREAH